MCLYLYVVAAADQSNVPLKIVFEGGEGGEEGGSEGDVSHVAP